MFFGFDYEGKAKYLKMLKHQGYKAEDIIFVGNSDNDEWAYSEGCKTICINPENAEETNWQKWHKVCKDVTHLGQMFSHLDMFEEKTQIVEFDCRQTASVEKFKTEDVAEI